MTTGTLAFKILKMLLEYRIKITGTLVSSVLFFSFFSQASECEYGKAESCPTGFTCINYDKGVAKCFENFLGPIKQIQSPFEKSLRFYCDQGPLSPKGNSHTWLNTGHAVDLKSYSTNSQAPLLAVADGEVIAHSNCKTQNDQCGAGFGNQVKILGEDGFLYFYAHLSQVNVTSGEVVKKGQRIGIEGMTGWTGENNPHLHFSVHFDWRKSPKQDWLQLGWLPPSVPFEVQACEATDDCKCKMGNISSDKLKCKRISKMEVPYCGGL